MNREQDPQFQSRRSRDVSVALTLLLACVIALLGWSIASHSGRFDDAGDIAVGIGVGVIVWYLVRGVLFYKRVPQGRECLGALLGSAAMVTLPMLTPLLPGFPHFLVHALTFYLPGPPAFLPFESDLMPAGMPCTSYTSYTGCFLINWTWELAYLLLIVSVFWSAWLIARLISETMHRNRSVGTWYVGVTLISLAYALTPLLTRLHGFQPVTWSASIWGAGVLCGTAGVVAVLCSRLDLWACVAALPLIGVARITDQVYLAHDCVTLYTEILERPWTFLGWLVVTLVLLWAFGRQWLREQFGLKSVLWALAIAIPIAAIAYTIAWNNMGFLGDCRGRYSSDIHQFMGPFAGSFGDVLMNGRFMPRRAATAIGFVSVSRCSRRVCSGIH